MFRAMSCLALSLAAAVAARAQTPEVLYEAAKKEGLVTWYSVILANEAALPLARAFEARYPGVRVDHQRGNTMLNAQKVIDEAKAGTPKGDVFDGSTTVAPIIEAGLADPWVPPSAAAIPEIYRDPAGRWNAVLLEFLTVGYNADMVAPADVPKTRDDLLDPKWRGKMIWSRTPGLTGAAGFVANTLMDMGEDRGMAFLAKLKAQDITSHPGDGHAVIELLAQRKFPIGLQIFNHHTFIERGLGHNIQWIRMEPVLSFSNNMGIVRGAPHPNAARLFVNFVLSPEGQTIIRDGRHIPASSAVEALEPSLKTGFRVNYVSPVMASEKLTGWQTAFAKAFP